MVISYVIVRCRRHSGVYTYHCKEIDFTFQVLEKDTCDVLVLGDGGDSIFYQAPYNGGYLGIDFFLSVDSNIIYLSPYFPIIYNKVTKKYKMQSITLVLHILMINIGILVEVVIKEDIHLV